MDITTAFYLEILFVGWLWWTRPRGKKKKAAKAVTPTAQAEPSATLPRILPPPILNKYEPTEEDAQFEKEFQEQYPNLELWFYTSVVGVTFKNDDRTSRRKVVRERFPMEMLLLRREPANPYDSKAIAVTTTGGQQLGYLERRVAADVGRLMEHEEMFAIFKRAKFSPADGEVVGAVVLITRFVKDG